MNCKCGTDMDLRWCCDHCGETKESDLQEKLDALVEASEKVSDVTCRICLIQSGCSECYVSTFDRAILKART